MSGSTYCPDCGSKNEYINGSKPKFCSSCGYDLRSLSLFISTASKPRATSKRSLRREDFLEEGEEDDERAFEEDDLEEDFEDDYDDDLNDYEEGEPVRMPSRRSSASSRNNVPRRGLRRPKRRGKLLDVDIEPTFGSKRKMDDVIFSASAGEGRQKLGTALNRKNSSSAAFENFQNIGKPRKSLDI